MKTLLIILISVTLSLGASAQHRIYYHSYHPKVYVVPSYNYGLGFGYPYFGNPYYGDPYYGNPYYGNRHMPYKLSLQIQSIKIDHKNKIRTARKDKSVSQSKRRQEIRSLKAERDQAIIDAQQNFRQRRNNPGMNNYQNPGNNNSSQGDNS